MISQNYQHYFEKRKYYKHHPEANCLRRKNKWHSSVYLGQAVLELLKTIFFLINNSRTSWFTENLMPIFGQSFSDNMFHNLALFSIQC